MSGFLEPGDVLGGCAFLMSLPDDNKRLVESYFRRRGCAKRYLDLPFGPWLGVLIVEMRAEEYSRQTIRLYLNRLLGPGVYLQAQGLDARHLADDKVVTDYLEYRKSHSLGRRGQPLGPAICSQLRWVIRRLVRSAQKAGYLESKQAAEASTSVPEVENYLQFCETHRGLGSSAWWIYRHWLERCRLFLLSLDPPKEFGTAAIEDLDRFTAQVGKGYSRSTAHRVVGALRNFFRYRFVLGLDPVDRSAWLDYPLVYRQMRVPRHLTSAQLDEALGRIDRTDPVGKRDWAIWAILSHYGLRAGEVASLSLADVDWEYRRLKVPRLKGGRLVLLPLVPRVEEALRDYLQNGRPGTSCTALFVTHVAPIHAFPNGPSLSNSCVRKYLAKDAGLTNRGAHVLRHTVARQMREQGASVGAIRNVLGHQDSDTTFSYLRLALEELREVAANYADLLP